MEGFEVAEVPLFHGSKVQSFKVKIGDVRAGLRVVSEKLSTLLSSE
jgi:hypothetical protein